MVDYPRLDYPEGASLVDVRYYNRPEQFEVVFINPILGKLDVKYEEALIDIWCLKEDCRTNKFQIAQTKTNECYKIICKPSQVPKIIAEQMGGEWKDWYEGHKGVCSNREMSNHMCECPWVFKADFLPDVYFRLRWLQTFGRKYDLSKVTYGFMDIEIDVIDRVVDLGNIQSYGTQPINAVTVILPEQKICAVHILGPRPEDEHYIDKSYFGLLKKQKKDWEWLQTHQEEFKRRIIEDDEDNRKYLKDYRVDLWLFDYKDEMKMMGYVFQYISKYRPMFMLSWNAKFDHNYIWKRFEFKGWDPKSFFIPKEFTTDRLFYNDDRNVKSGIKNSRDWFFVSSYTTYICQERLFAAIRKSQSEQRSYSLSYIGKKIAKIDKLGHDKFRDFAYLDLLKFILYNVRDVVVQLAVEMKCNDCRSLMSRSYMFATQFSKCFQETHIVRNIREYYYEKLGFIQSCKLIVEPGIDTHFKGAFVADPTLNAFLGYMLNGIPCNCMIYGALDADAKSYYPSTKMGCNLDPMSLEFKCIIEVHLFATGKLNNRSLNQEYYWKDSEKNTHPEDMSAYIFNSYKNKNECYVLYSYFNLPSITQYMEYIKQNY